MSVCGQFFQMERLIVQEHRIVKTLETVLARYTRCELFLARFYDARLQESLHFTMKKLEAVSECRRCMIMQKLRFVQTLETVLARVCFNLCVSVVILSGDSREGSSDFF